jgi:5-methyltetrahydrofolate--homocysteine methyltransferase
MAQKLPDLRNEVLLCDGAMGTMIQKTEVLKPGEAPELLNLTHPEVITAIHHSYIEAGSRYIGTNTFGGNRIKLGNHSITGDTVRDVNFAGVKIAKNAALSNGALVAASLGPTGKMIEPLGDLSFDAAFTAFQEQCRFFAEAGADIITIETMSDLQETKAAILAALEVNLPVIATVSFMENGRLLTGPTPEMVGAVLSGFPLMALGTNCGLSAHLLKPIVEKLMTYSAKPLILQPNAGKPSLNGNETVYQESPSEFADAAIDLVRLGARMIGGCCGTTPEHIRLLKGLLNQEENHYIPANTEDYLVGKSSLTNPAAIQNPALVWRLNLESEEALWKEIYSGNPDPLIDRLLEIDSEQYQLIEINGEALSNQDLEYFKNLVNAVSTYWHHPIGAILTSEPLIKALLTGNSGRSYVITSPKNTALIEIISKYGGYYQPMN